MIEAVCDNCGRRITLKCQPGGFELPEIWKLEFQYMPLERLYHYKAYCFNCRLDKKEAKE